MNRRRFLASSGAAMIAPFHLSAQHPTIAAQGKSMYGRIGKMTAVSGQRDALAAILLESTKATPGCLS